MNRTQTPDSPWNTEEDRDARKPAAYDLDNEATEPTDGDKQIDDPIHIYLMQISKIPMLSRMEEIEVAKRIEHSRRRFRYGVLGTDYILRAAIGLMEKLCQGSLRLDRTVEVSVTNVREKRRIMGVLGPNLRTLQALVERNRETSSSPSVSGVPCPNGEPPGTAWPIGGSRPCG